MTEMATAFVGTGIGKCRVMAMSAGTHPSVPGENSA